MQYEQFKQSVRDLDFIGDEQTADAAVKAVLGVLVSRLDEDEAQRVTDHLPEPLTIDTLRGHQATPTTTPAPDYFNVIADQFHIDTNQASDVIARILRLTHDSLPDDERRRMIEHLPEDWRALVTAA